MVQRLKRRGSIIYEIGDQRGLGQDIAQYLYLIIAVYGLLLRKSTDPEIPVTTLNKYVHVYSKTCQKRSLKNRRNKNLYDKW